MEPVRVDFTYTPDDLADAHALAGRAPGEPGDARRGRTHVIGWAIFGGLAIVFFLFMQRSPPTRPAQPPSEWDWVIRTAPWVIVSLLVWGLVWWQKRHAARSAWTQRPGLQQPQTVVVADDGVTLTGAASETRWQWNAFVGWAESDASFLLRQPGGIYFALPKRAATPEQIIRIREAFDRHVVQSAGGFPVLPAPE